MSLVSAAAFKRLLAAAEVLHAHGKGPLHKRLFKASGMLFEGSVHSFEMYRRSDGAHTAQTDVPFCPRNFSRIITRIGELVPLENPIFPYLVRGETHPLRLSDLMSERQFRRTNLYHDVFRDVELKHQMVIPMSTPTHAGALTINRDTVDYSEEDLHTSVIFARHVALAHASDQILTESAPQRSRVQAVDFSPLRRLKLSHRESEVLWWISQGKRDREAAAILGVSLRTVNHHVSAILRKLGVETRAAAVALFHRQCGGKA